MHKLIICISMVLLLSPSVEAEGMSPSAALILLTEDNGKTDSDDQAEKLYKLYGIEKVEHVSLDTTKISSLQDFQKDGVAQLDYVQRGLQRAINKNQDRPIIIVAEGWASVATIMSLSGNGTDRVNLWGDVQQFVTINHPGEEAGKAFYKGLDRPKYVKH